MSCSGRTGSAAESAVLAVLMGGLALASVSGAVLFLRARHLYPLAQRSPALAVASLAALVLLLLLSAATTAFPAAFLCGPAAAFSNLLFLVGAITVAVRFAGFCVQYQAQQAIVLHRRRSVDWSRSPTLLFRVRSMLSSQIKVFLLITGLVLVFWIPSLLIISFSPFWNHKMTSGDCGVSLIRLSSYLMMGEAAIILITYFALFSQVTRIRENFYLSEEIRNLIIVGIYLFLTFLVNSFVPKVRETSQCKFRFMIIIGNLVPGYAFVYVTLIQPLLIALQTQKILKNIDSMSLTMRKSALNFKAAYTIESLRTILSNPEKRDFFQQFLVKEFATESLLFWVAVEELNPLKEDLSKLKDASCTLFDEFISPSALLSINIGSKTRVKLTAQINALRDGSLEYDLVQDIFSEAKREIEELMFDDPYRRFRDSIECKQMQRQRSVQNIEIQVERALSM